MMITLRVSRSALVCFNVLLEPYFLTDLLTHAVTYKETTMPVIEHYEKQGKVAQVRLKSSLALLV
jgi:hypothetical protein